MMRRFVLGILSILIFAALAQAQTSQPASTQPARDYNNTPADIPFAKLSANGSPDNGFLARHKDFIARGKAGPIGILFLGDSITDFWDNPRRADNKAVFDKYYSKFDPADFGISGDRTQHLLWRIENGELDNIHPKLVILNIGTNNFLQTSDEIYAGVKKIVDVIHEKLPQSKLLIIGIFPRGHDPSDANAYLDSRYKNGPHLAEGRARLNAVNAKLAKLDDGKMTRYLDVGPKFLDDKGVLDKSIMADYLHPTPKGYEIWAEAMQPTIDEMMK